jgi:hypothetical protein
MRGVKAFFLVSFCKISKAQSPERRMTATPPRPGAEASAKMVLLCAEGLALVIAQYISGAGDAAHEMRLDHFFGLFDGFDFIPYTFGIDDHDGPEFTAVKAARLVDARICDAQFFDAGLDIIAHGIRAFGLAAAAGMFSRSFVATDKKVILVKHDLPIKVNCSLKDNRLS